MTPFNTLDNRAFCLTRSQFLYLEAANASSTSPPVEVIVIESSPEVDDVEPSYYDCMELKHWFMARQPYDLRTRAGRKWKRDFIAAGFEFPVKIGQGTYHFEYSSLQNDRYIFNSFNFSFSFSFDLILIA